MDIITNADILKIQIENDKKDLSEDVKAGLYDLVDSFPMMVKRVNRIIEKNDQWIELVNAIPGEVINELTERI